MTVTTMTMPVPSPPITDIRCPSCGKPFQRVSGPIVIGRSQIQDDMRVIRLECICKNRACKRAFTVQVGVLS